jgi:protein-S-isoprenylcysteine O-methyltransferase Ste14
MVETIFVISLFLIFLLLWGIKRARQKKLTGVDPLVMSKSTSNVQVFMAHYSDLLMIYAAVIILAHSINIQAGSLFSRADLFSSLIFDLSGFAAGLIGLALCLYAQLKMGESWRVGIDEKIKTQLITTGLYKFIRNPTYLGIILLNIGVWLIWPTWTIFLLNVLFTLFLEIQVRCEEDYLILIHGEQYMEYKKRTKRYLPYVY